MEINGGEWRFSMHSPFLFLLIARLTKYDIYNALVYQWSDSIKIDTKPTVREPGRYNSPLIIRNSSSNSKPELVVQNHIEKIVDR